MVNIGTFIHTASYYTTFKEYVVIFSCKKIQNCAGDTGFSEASSEKGVVR